MTPRRVHIVAAMLAAVLALPSVAPPARAAETLAYQWSARVGIAGANGSVVAKAFVAGSGSVALSLRGLRAGATYGVTVLRGSCLRPGSALFALPAATASSTGRLTRTYVLSAARVTAVRSATSTNSGRVAIRIGSGTGARCGTFAVTPVHRIGIRVTDGKGFFVDRWSGQQFVPRGNNLIRLDTQPTRAGTVVYHSLLNPSLYDAADVDAQLTRMAAAGYNAVRVWLNHCCPTDALGSPTGVNPAYLDAVVGFLRLAKAKGLLVMLTIDGTPDDGPFGIGWTETFEGENGRSLSALGVRNNTRLWQAVIRGLIDRNAPFDAIWSYELRNELSFDANLKPLSQTSGLVTTANGRTYDMASAADKQRMMDEGLVYFIDQVRAGIRSLAPSALVSIGFFVPQGPNPMRPGDTRVIETQPAIWQSAADFIDLHAYPGWDSLEDHVENFGIDGMERKPIVLGEFGAFLSQFPTLAAARSALVAWQAESCRFGFDGWLLWDWDRFDWNGLSGNGEIAAALSPQVRPDPCAP